MAPVLAQKLRVTWRPCMRMASAVSITWARLKAATSALALLRCHLRLLAKPATLVSATWLQLMVLDAPPLKAKRSGP